MLKFYDIEVNYMKFLKTFDDKVPDIEYETNNKFVTGILLSINNCEYYAPVSSFKIKQRTNFIIKDKDKKAISSVRFSFMFPVPKKLKNKLLNIKDFSKQTREYRNLLIKELNYVNKNSDKILQMAQDIYERRIKNQKLYVENCCNFKLLEEKSKLYIPEFYIYQDREQGKLVVFNEENIEERYNLYGKVEVPKEQIGIIRNLRQLSDLTTFALIDENNKNKSFYSTISKKVYETIDKLNEATQSITQ